VVHACAGALDEGMAGQYNCGNITHFAPTILPWSTDHPTCRGPTIYPNPYTQQRVCYTAVDIYKRAILLPEFMLSASYRTNEVMHYRYD